MLTLDGVPFDLLGELVERGDTPHLARLIERHGVRRMCSVQPTVSCVAWASYMTGKNPGKHGVYGFIDRRPDSYDLALPNAANLQGEHLWEILSRAGKRVFGMNVPCTYPPRPVNGVLIGGFLAPSIDKAAYPAGVGDTLRRLNYRIDSDPALARQDKKAMLADLGETLAARRAAMLHFLDQEPWDFFHTHVMGTDRINHFLLGQFRADEPGMAEGFRDFYRQVDKLVGDVLAAIGPDTPLLLFSDHGFCPIRYEVQLSRYLVEMGWTVPADPVRHPLSIDPTRSKAYCLIPGRIHINLEGREPQGIVPREDYHRVRAALWNSLASLRDPDNGAVVIDRILGRESAYWAVGTDGPTAMDPVLVRDAKGTFGGGPDLICIPRNGYDLKLGLAGDKVFTRSALEGMHTYDDAFIIGRGVALPPAAEHLEIMMLAGRILEALGVAVPEDMDVNGAGQPL